MIDLHCHLDLYPDPHAVAAECERRRLYVLSVTTTPTAFEGTARLVRPDGRVRTALGLHPELAVARAHELVLFERLLPLTAYVGEVGLDGSTPHRSTLQRQRAILGDILRMCSAAGGRKLTLHSRGATGAILDELAAEPRAGTFVLHWYLGSGRQIARASEMGAWFSVGPSMLAGERGRTAVASMPRDRILPESDGPFGMLEGEPAYPWDAWRVVSELAALWHIPADDVEQLLMQNFRAFSA